MDLFDQKMTLLADEVRELSGTTNQKGLDEIASDISTANEDIAVQAAIISQIANTLEGKASGGSGGYEIGTFTLENYFYQNAGTSALMPLPFIIGQTWQEWVTSPLNVPVGNSGLGAFEVAINSSTN